MCLSLPARVLAVEEGGGMAVADVDGSTRRIPLTVLQLEGQHVGPGDWLVVHTGLAVRVLSEPEAVELLELHRAMRSPASDDGRAG